MTIKTILITGISGYVGTNLANFLTMRQYRVIGLIRSRSSINKNLICNHFYEYEGNYSSISKIFEENQVDLVIHLASYTCYDCVGNEISDMIAANINLGTQLLFAMSEFKCGNLINLGSFFQAYDQNKAPNPVCLYAATKNAFEKIIDYFVFNSKIQAYTVYLFDVYGAFDPRKKLLYSLKEAVRTGQAVDMTNGEQFLYMTYVEDVCLGIQSLFKKFDVSQACHKQYHILGDYLQLRDMVKKYVHMMNHQIKINWGALPYRNNQIFYPVRLGELIQINTTTFEEGIQKINEKENFHYYAGL